MKRRISSAIVLCLLLCLLLSACGSGDPALVGTWESNMDVTDSLTDFWQEQGITLKTTEKLYLQLELVLTDDGRCSMYYDSADSAVLAEGYFTAVLGELIEIVYEAEGRSREETDAYYASMDTSVEALCETLLKEPRAIVEELIAQSEPLENGFYRVDEGKLYMEATKSQLNKATEHLDYHMQGDVLTLSFGDQTVDFVKK